MYNFFSTCWKPGVAVLLLALWSFAPAYADGTETLGAPSVTLASGSGMAAAGVGLATQPGIINITVPVVATVEQVLLYWEGHNFSASGDNTILVNGTEVTGTLIGGPTLFFLNGGTTPTYSTTFRADITDLGAVTPGANAVAVEGLVYDLVANGAGIIAVYDDGTETELFLIDGNDCMYKFFAPPLDGSVAQTFTFGAATTARVAPLKMFFSSVQGLASTGGLLRPNRISVTVGGVTTNYDDILDSNEGEEWDTFIIDVDIPAGETQLTVQAFSGPDGDEDENTPVERPASFTWTGAALAVPVPEEQCEGTIGNFVWKDKDCDGNQDGNEPGIAGVTVKLLDSLGAVLETATTDANGYYLFTGLCLGSYTVTVDATTLPAGYTATTCSNVAGNGTNSNCSPAEVILTTNTTEDLTIDFGYCEPEPCVSGEFSFYGNTSTSGTRGNIRTFTVNGVSVKVSAFSRLKNAATWETAYLGLYSHGLGVTDKYEGSGSNGSHRVDNIDKNNYVLFEFSTPVVLTRAYLDAIVTDSDISVWIGTFTDPFNNHITLSDGALSGMLAEQNETTSGSARWAGFNGGQILANTLVIAADVIDTTPEDQFKIRKLEYGCIPTPPSGGGDGCTPGYWKQCHHYDSWPYPYKPWTKFRDVFDNAFGSKTLLQVLKLGGGGLNALGRHTVAALLNAKSGGVEYALTTTQVISMFNNVYPGNSSQYETLKNIFEDNNESGCPLNRAGVAGEEVAPTTPQLMQNYPNPFNPETAIYFVVPEASQVTLKIYNTLGQEVRTLMDGMVEAGMHEVTWNGRDGQDMQVGSGIYFYQLRAGDVMEMKKMSLLK